MTALQRQPRNSENLTNNPPYLWNGASYDVSKCYSAIKCCIRISIVTKSGDPEDLNDLKRRNGMVVIFLLFYRIGSFGAYYVTVVEIKPYYLQRKCTLKM